MSTAGEVWRRRLANRSRLIANALREETPRGDGPLVTVIIATYNWSSVLRHAITSVLWQTHANLELLVVGDACTDDSEEVVASFGDPRIRWENLSANSGSQAGPNNRGLELARGELIAYQGHDDVWHPKHLATLVAGIQRAGADLTWTVAEVLGPPGSRIRRLSGLSATGRRGLGTWIPPCSAMHRRSLTDAIGGWADWQAIADPVDVEFFDRAQLSGARLEAIASLTAFKFPATLRPGSYRERPSAEQAQYVRRVRSRRAMVLRELAATFATQISPLPERDARPLSPSSVPGELARQSRRLRGLD